MWTLSPWASHALVDSFLTLTLYVGWADGVAMSSPQGLGQGWVLSSPQGSVQPDLPGVLGLIGRSPGQGWSSTGFRCEPGLFLFIFCDPDSFLTGGNVFCSWDLLMLSAAHLTDAKDGVMANLKKWEVERAWRTAWQNSQPACSGSVEKRSLALSSCPGLTTHFRLEGPTGLMVGL